MSDTRKCNRCGKRLNKGDFPWIVYCSLKCSRPTVDEFNAELERRRVGVPEKGEK
jgi:hypothetical protein